MGDSYLGLCYDENEKFTSEGLQELGSNSGKFAEPTQLATNGREDDVLTHEQQENGKDNDNQERASDQKMDEALLVFDDVWKTHLF